MLFTICFKSKHFDIIVLHHNFLFTFILFIYIPQLCKEVAPRLNLSAVCQQFIACQFYLGVLELCLSCAEKVDPNNAALHYYKNNEPIEDQEAYTKRY